MKNSHDTPQPSRLDLVKRGVGMGANTKRQGRLIVSVEKIVEDPRNERKTFRGMEGLVASIKAVGLIEPITVTLLEGDAYMIVTGHRRFRAAKAAGLDTVEVLIRDPEAEQLRRRKSIVSNVQREDLGPVEIAEGLRALLEEDTEVRTQRQLAAVIGKSEQWVSDLLRVLDLPPQLQEKLRTAVVRVPYDSAVRVARLKAGDLQRELVDDLLGGATKEEIRAKIDASKGKPHLSDAGKPKIVYQTSQKAAVIVQATDTTLTRPRVIAAIKEALKAVKKDWTGPTHTGRSPG